MNYVIAFDLGTSSLKASIVDQNLNIIKSTSLVYPTYSAPGGINEQRPLDWKECLFKITKELLKDFKEASFIKACAMSGHSLGVVMVDKENNLVSEYTPIWNDKRAGKQADSFFEKIDYKDWYNQTGNGFTRELYSIFKIMWYKENEYSLYEKTYKFIGTKDYLNMVLCGVIATDHSYASGSGVYNLKDRCYNKEFIKSSGISYDKLPEIKESSDVLGPILPSVAEELGLPYDLKVVCGGVDNACMTLGAGCFKKDDCYVSLGSSSWIAVSDNLPTVDFDKKIYTWAHVVKGLYIPSSGIFSCGSAKDYMIDNFFKDLGVSKYEEFDALVSKSPVGANSVYFNPVLAGGSYVDASTDMKGGLVNFDLSTSRADIARAILEGISFDLKLSFDALNAITSIDKKIAFVGGGTASSQWLQIFADVFDKDIVKLEACRSAATIGAASLALFGIGLIKDYSILENESKVLSVTKPIKENVNIYKNNFLVFVEVCNMHAKIQELINRKK